MSKTAIGECRSIVSSSLIRLLGLSLAIACLPAAAFAQEEKPPLRWGADAEGGAPYIFVDPKRPEVQIGFEVDLAESLAKELGRPIRFQQYAYANLAQGVLRGDFDFAMNGLEVTEDRQKQILFTRPYYRYQLQLVARAGESRFKSLAELKAAGGIVATLEDTAAERMLDKLGIEKRIYDSQAEPYVDLKLKRVDAVLLDLPIATYYAKPDPKLQFIGLPLGLGSYAIALKPDHTQLKEELDSAIGRLIEKGELRRIYERWGIWNDAQDDLAQDRTNIVATGGDDMTIDVYLPLLLQSSLVTIFISVVSMALAIMIGLLVACARVYGPLWLSWLAMIYVEFFRGIPVLLLLYTLYYGLPGMAEYYGLARLAEDYGLPVSLQMPALVAAILGFGLNYGAYEAEIYRAGIEAVPRGQWEAAASLGMSPWLTFRRIILPQAWRIALPPMTNDFVALFKDTSLVSVISVIELTKQYQILSKSSLKYLEIGLCTAALYLLMSVPLGYLSKWLEAHSKPGE